MSEKLAKLAKIVINDESYAPSLERLILDNLMTAVIERALRDALATSIVDQYTMREARAWLRSQDEEEGSFLWMATLLDLSPPFLLRVKKLLLQ